MRYCQFALLVLFPLATALPVEALEPRRSTATQIRRWIDQLDHDDFAVRERAAAQLAHAGPQAIRPLAEGVVSQNPEVAWRSSETLERIAMEGDEATMDKVVQVLGQLASQGKPQLAQFASQMRQRQRVFRHNRAATALRKLGGQVAGGESEMTTEAAADIDLAVVEDVPAMAALERFIIEDAPAIELPVAEVEGPKLPGRPAWLELLEAMTILKAKKDPKPDNIEIADGADGVLPPDAPAVEPEAGEARPPAISDRVAAAVLPGKVGDAFRRALGLGEKEAPRVADEGPEGAKDFDLPDLEGAAEAPEVVVAEEKLEAEPEPAIEAMVLDVGVAGGPVFFGGGMVMGFDGGVSQGYLVLGREWRGGEAGLKHLKDLSGVSSLQIEHADLSDAALPHVAKLKSLKHLQIRGGKFSREALRTFHRQRPEVSLMAMGQGMMGVNAPFGSDTCVLETVFEGSGAHDAGLQPGDKVTAIDGEEVRDFSDLTILVSTRKPGDTLKVDFERDGEQREAKVTLKPRAPGQ